MNTPQLAAAHRGEANCNQRILARRWHLGSNQQATVDAAMCKTKATSAKIIIGDGTLSYEEEERFALLMILHLGDRNIAEGKVVPLAVAMKRLRARIRKHRKNKR
jgi:hypothetical protein